MRALSKAAPPSASGTEMADHTAEVKNRPADPVEADASSMRSSHGPRLDGAETTTCGVDSALLPPLPFPLPFQPPLPLPLPPPPDPPDPPDPNNTTLTTLALSGVLSERRNTPPASRVRLVPTATTGVWPRFTMTSEPRHEHELLGPNKASAFATRLLHWKRRQLWPGPLTATKLEKRMPSRDKSVESVAETTPKALPALPLPPPPDVELEGDGRGVGGRVGNSVKNVGLRVGVCVVLGSSVVGTPVGVLGESVGDGSVGEDVHVMKLGRVGLSVGRVGDLDGLRVVGDRDGRDVDGDNVGASTGDLVCLGVGDDVVGLPVEAVGMSDGVSVAT